MTPISTLRERFQAVLHQEFERAWLEYRMAMEAAKAWSAGQLPQPDGMLLTRQTWDAVGRARLPAYWALRRYTGLVHAHSPSELLEWARKLMGWECDTEADIVARIEVELKMERKRPGRQGGKERERTA